MTHPGVVAIRDEFRRAWNILEAVGYRQTHHAGLFDELVEPKREDAPPRSDGNHVKVSGPTEPITATDGKASPVPVSNQD